MTDELLRRAIFDPAVRTRRIYERQPGWLVDVEDLHQALGRLVPTSTLSIDELDRAVRRHGGYRVERLLGNVSRAALRWLTRGRWPNAARQQYWLDMYSWQKLRQRRR